jgi:release factor glutamine methyltransferase
MTISEALKHGTKIIGRRDALLLLCHVTGQNAARILLCENENLTNSEKFLQYVSRRKQNEPLQYIIGEWEFMGQTIKTDKRALIPRPETELVTEEALKFLKPGMEVLDLCTGSGCIAAAIAKAGDYRVTAADISPEALSLAKENGEGLNINFILSDLFCNVKGKFDLIISNPPYITNKEMETLSASVLRYEPLLALRGGPDGMDIYRELIPRSLGFLKPGGGLFLEIGPAYVKNILTEHAFINVKIKNDYGGLPRIVYGFAPGTPLEKECSKNV